MARPINSFFFNNFYLTKVDEIYVLFHSALFLMAFISTTRTITNFDNLRSLHTAACIFLTLTYFDHDSPRTRLRDIRSFLAGKIIQSVDSRPLTSSLRHDSFCSSSIMVM